MCCRTHQKSEAVFAKEILAMDERIFFQHLNLTKPAFNYLLDKIKKDDAPRRVHGKQQVPAVECLLLTLWFLGVKHIYTCCWANIKVHKNYQVG